MRKNDSLRAQHPPRRGPRGIPAERAGSLLDASAVPPDARAILDDFLSVAESSRPLSSRQRALLPGYIRELSHALTDERTERRLGYMNQTTTLSAYVHYYLWWNLVRLTRLFASLPAEFFDLPAGSVCTDIGSGPLTVPLALLLARPELRRVPLTWYCVDVSAQAMAQGEDIFLAVAACLRCEPWKIVRVKGSIGTPLRQKAKLVACANTLNEIVQDAQMPPEYLAKTYAGQLLSYADSGAARVLVVEPGVPRNARFVSLLRDALLRRSFAPCSPCPHAGECPMDGRRGGKWCNFAFGTEDAPAALKKLSAESRLPKERAVLSFIAAVQTPRGAVPAAEQDALWFRIASDAIRLPGRRTGFYACSAAGLLLVVSGQALASGECYVVRHPRFPLPVDEKSGAFILEGVEPLPDGRGDFTNI